MKDNIIHTMQPEEYVLHLPDKKVIFKNGSVSEMLVPVDEDTFVVYKSILSLIGKTVMIVSSVQHKYTAVNVDTIKKAILNSKESISKIIYIAMSMVFMTSEAFNTTVNYKKLSFEHKIKNIDNTADYLWLYNASLIIIDKFSIQVPDKIQSW